MENHQDRFQSSSYGSSDRSQSYAPYKWENESHGNWNRATWEERGWKTRPYHSNITWRAEDQSQEDDKNKERQDVQGRNVPVKAAPKMTRSNPPVSPVVPPPVTGSDVQAP
eukprot:6487734-Amphidinium_carterae.1